LASRPQRRADIINFGDWIAIMDERGQWMVAESGSRRDVLRDPDPLQRIQAVHLAASAPLMKSALDALVRKLENCGWKDDGDYRRGRVLQFAHGALSNTVPPIDRFLTLLHARQLELGLDRDLTAGVA
jgi:hypothetical protein